jgi:hypothetical protein
MEGQQMTKPKRLMLMKALPGLVAAGALALAGGVVRPASVRADFLRYNPPPFDFSDEFYQLNGVDPDHIVTRVGNPDRDPATWLLDASNTDPTRRGVRVKETTGGFDKNGNLIYYSIMGMMTPATFTNGEAGVQARALAERFRAFIFPKTERNPDHSIRSVTLSPAPPNRRQDNLFDTKTGYLCENLLGLWVLSFAIYTQPAFTTPEGQQALAALAAHNGVDVDGTPVIKRLEEIDALTDQGFLELRSNPESGGDGPRWVI